MSEASSGSAESARPRKSSGAFGWLKSKFRRSSRSASKTTPPPTDNGGKHDETATASTNTHSATTGPSARPKNIVLSASTRMYTIKPRAPPTEQDNAEENTEGGVERPVQSLAEWSKPSPLLGPTAPQVDGSQSPEGPHPTFHNFPTDMFGTSNTSKVAGVLQDMQRTTDESGDGDDTNQSGDGEKKQQGEGKSSENKGLTPNKRLRHVLTLVQSTTTDMQTLRKVAWRGLPPLTRGDVWKLLSGYMPVEKSRRADLLLRRRNEYAQYLADYYYISDDHKSAGERRVLKQIRVDLPRTCPRWPFFQVPAVQKSLERILYMWSIRHPASSYVQGINDLCTPFLVVFLEQMTSVDPKRVKGARDLVSVEDRDWIDVEADVYWNLSWVLDAIQDHYTHTQPGIRRKVLHLDELIQRIDKQLHDHLKDQGVMFMQFAFRWMNCLLMRELSLELIVRLWDTYLAEGSDGFAEFHVYVCAAFLMKFHKELKEMQFQDIVMFLQNPPTTLWSVDDIGTLVSQAYVYQTYYQNSPNHLVQK